jgi:predicted dehydrogenase
VVAAVASRNAGVAGEYAAAHGTPRHLGDYHSSLADQEIELVYVALPQSEHARWSIAAVHPTWG